MKRCPFCQSADLTVTSDADLHWAECLNPECGAEGPMRDTATQAVEAWNVAIRVPTDPQANCHHLEWCPVCNPGLKP